MKKKNISLTVFLVIYAICIAQLLYYYPQLPEKIASHFGRSGQPDEWATKMFFAKLYLIVTGTIAIIFLCISFGVPKIPLSFISIPNKDYWLSEERKKDTFDFIFYYFLLFASATLLFLLDMFNQSFQVQLGKANSLSHPTISSGIYIGFILAWCIGMLVRFRIK